MSLACGNKTYFALFVLSLRVGADNSLAADGRDFVAIHGLKKYAHFDPI
jgi:hypothetical protein